MPSLALGSEKTEKRRSTRISQMVVPVVKKTNTRSSRSLHLKGAPQRQEVSDSSASSSSGSSDEDEYQPTENDVQDEADDHMDYKEFSPEIDEDFSDSPPVTSLRSRTNSDSSDKENGRRRTRSTKRAANETPSKILAEKLSKTSLTTPKKNSARDLRSSKTPTKRKDETPRENMQKSRGRPRKVFLESDGDLSEEEDVSNKRENQTPRERLTMKIPKNMIKPRITPVVISKTPGGTLRTRRRMRQNSEELDDVVDPLDSNSAKTLKELASRLHLSKVPEQLPCREAEAREIESFIREVIDRKRGESSAMYISGVPGTGKTATVRAVVNAMKKNAKCPKFVYVEVNAMIFKKTVFVEIHNGIQEEFNISKKSQTRAKISASTARQELNDIFKKQDSKRPPIVILIDELDSLCNRKQDVLYDIFEWTALPQSKVTIIGIANTLDFPERMLCQRNASRLDKRRLVFQPYRHEQIQEIVRARLQGSNLVEKKAVELVAKKIAMNTGDLRQALDFLCRSIGVAVEKKAEKLEVVHVLEAQKAVLESLKYRLVKGLRLHQLTLFRAVENLTRENEEVIFAEIYKNYCIICSKLSGIEPASDNFAYGMLLELATTSLVTLARGDHGTMNRRVKLGMTTMEAERAIKEATEKHKSIYSV
ncbi:hypothetical protein L5515_003766 [Caenorhabditis briggsae]|uniref:Origin recognition complex subunit 1 n=1 Tax=Caenorhabditis briggsae TaxID=6238 RepID=A0AAE9ELQ4_CAEBR|nr:hypothetical protein L5515_003766 [Caenorhabditis briggsae]